MPATKREEVVEAAAVASAPVEEVEQGPSREQFLEDQLRDALSRLERLESRPYVPASPPNQLRTALTPQQILAKVSSPGDTAGGSAIWDPLAEYGFRLAFSDEQVVEVVDEEWIARLRFARVLNSNERAIGIIRNFTHRHPTTNEPKYRVDFREGVPTDCFPESKIKAYNG